MNNSCDVKLIAFYLPQYHPIPENDEWWGKGFTEWTNVTKAKPNFEGHYQPHLPTDLGFYDLRVPEMRIAQAEMAKRYGISGFCYYYYWFGGKRLLNRPLDEVLESKQPDFPFCICWANENWTRRWDGLENEILIAQNHSLEDDRNFINSLISAFKDSRYIRVNGKPLLIVYRINLLPNPQQTVELWRDECRKNGIEDIYLCAAQSFGINDPRIYGFDAAVEFPPNGVNGAEVTHQTNNITNEKFRGHVYDYNKAINSLIAKSKPDYKLFKSVTPSWDNTARKQDNGHIFINSNPQNYERWLSIVIEKTKQMHLGDERLVFINAWNEWAEGCHLEPDIKYGHAFLEATGNALKLSSLEFSLFTNSVNETFNLPKSEADRSEQYPLISICIPTYNGQKFINEALESAIFQTYPCIEIIVSDDGSRDQTIEIVRQFMQNHPDKMIRLYTHKQYGLNENWNFCISQANGKYIKFLFQDDLLENTCVEKMVAVAEQDNKIGLVFSPRSIFLDIDSKDNKDCIELYQGDVHNLHKYWSNLKSIQSGQELLRDPSLLENPGQNMIGEPSTVLIKRECFVNIGLFDPDLCQVTDIDMWYRIMGRYNIGFVDEELSKFRIHSNQASIKNKISGESGKDVLRWWKKLTDDNNGYNFISPEMRNVIKEKLCEYSLTTENNPFQLFISRNSLSAYLKKKFPLTWEKFRFLAIRLKLFSAS